MKIARLSAFLNFRHFLALLAVLILAGCATGPATMHTQVTSFNDWSVLPAEKTYAFSRTLMQRNALEVQSYEGLVREELDKIGFKESKDPAAAKILVTLRPSVSVVYMSEYDSAWDFPRGWGPYRRPYRGWYGYPYGYGYPLGMNRWDTAIYRHKLQLEMDLQGTAPLKRLYEATVQTDDWNNVLPKTMPYLVRALFSDFPGNNGETRNVDLVIDQKD